MSTSEQTYSFCHGFACRISCCCWRSYLKISSTLLTVSMLFDISHVLKAIEVSIADIFSWKTQNTTQDCGKEQNGGYLPILLIALHKTARGWDEKEEDAILTKSCKQRLYFEQKIERSFLCPSRICCFKIISRYGRGICAIGKYLRVTPYNRNFPAT